MTSILFAILFYLATLLFVVGLLSRISVYARTPAPLKIPTTPAPVSTGGVVLRLAREVVFFESLFKANLWTWGLGWLFHASLALVLLRHLRYFTEPVWAWVAFIQPFGMYAGITMLLGAAGLWGRRLFVERIRYISTPSDHLMLVLFMVIAASGLSMTFIAHTDVIAVKGFFLGLMSFNLQSLPEHAGLYVHLFMVAVLLMIFPISKLLHAPGIFFSPSRNQTDNPREKRHISAWAIQLESTDMGNAK
jgi:nitrate reductase gamma subunit